MLVNDPKNRSGKDNEESYKSNEPRTMNVDDENEEALENDDLEDDDILDDEDESEDGDDL